MRTIRANDGPRILEAFNTLDQESIYRRFFSPKKELSDAELKQLTEVDFGHVSALVVTSRRDGVETLLGGARFAVEAVERPQSAELAFLTQRLIEVRGSRAFCSGISRFLRKRPACRGLKQMCSPKISLCLRCFVVVACRCVLSGTVACFT